MVEVAVVVGRDGLPIHWHLPPDRTSCAIPDSRDLWEVLWENRERVLGVAHSHPGTGVPYPSQTDVTTFAAIEAALGMRLCWWICTQDGFGLFHYGGPGKHDYVYLPIRDYAWLPKLREHSYAP